MNTSTTRTTGMHKESRSITKVKAPPTIKIIHIFAPEIIQTDVSNFRELVQRLTGKPAHDKKITNKNKKKPRIPSDRQSTKTSSTIEEQDQDHGSNNINVNVARDHIRVKEEERKHVMTWHGDLNREDLGGFLGGFTDMEFEFLLMMPTSTSQVQYGFEDSSTIPQLFT